MSGVRRNGGISFWYDGFAELGGRPRLNGDRRVDVAIVGGGYTGLWAAYYLKRARPELEVVVLEREFCGFGASGRNGGWLSDHFSTPRAAMERTHGRAGVVAQQQAMRASIDEVIAVAAQEGIEADIVKHGLLTVARGPAQERRLAAAVAEDRAWGDTHADLLELDRPALDARVTVAGAGSGAWSPHCARIQPAKLVRGLAEVVARLGVTIHESTTVTEIVPGAAITDGGTVRADVVLSCLEGFTASLKGRERAWLPLNSAIVATDPLPDRVWDEIGWSGEELLGDAAHAYCYAQRTADGRIAMGGRGVPYRFGSRTDVNGATQETTIAQLTALLHDLFPATADVPIARAWCGVLGVPRDWASTVRLDPTTGLGTAGGYVGNGVTTANLAGRTLRDLVLGEQTELTGLPWVGHTARDWEPEPLRWIGARLVYGLYRAADRREQAGGDPRTSALAKAASLLAGR
jgi:glycine/D-amino acid oxidase-like deaminating enzyme